MATITVKDANGKDAGTVDVEEAVFGIEPNLHCVRQAYDAYRAGQRAGTHSTKTRGEVSGGGRKPYRQKGTGRARQGSIRANQWRGGAIVFGPSPRDYTTSVNRKVRKKAYASIFSDLASNNQLVALEDFAIKEPKTRELARLIRDLELDGFILIIHEGNDENLLLSARNIPYVTCAHVDEINIHDLLTHDAVLTTRGALARIGEIYS